MVTRFLLFKLHIFKEEKVLTDTTSHMGVNGQKSGYSMSAGSDKPDIG